MNRAQNERDDTMNRQWSNARLWTGEEALLYDFNDPDSQYVMFNRELEGCALLPFTKPMQPGFGTATVDGRAIPVSVHRLRIGDFQGSWLALRLGGVLHDYGRRAQVKLSGFRDADGLRVV